MIETIARTLNCGKHWEAAKSESKVCLGHQSALHFQYYGRKYFVLNTISLESSHLKKDFGDSQWRAAVNARGLRC